MRHCRLAILAILTLGPLAGCMFSRPAVVGSGTSITESYEFYDFERLDISSSFDVTLRQGPTKIVVSADDNVMPYVIVEEVDQHLRIGLNRSIRLRNATLKADITMPQVKAISLSGASRLKTIGFECTDLSLNASGASRFEGTLTANAFSLDMSGASRAKLSGAVDSTTAELSGASRAELEELTAGDCDLVLSGASRADVEAMGFVNANLSGASSVSLNQGAQMGEIKTSGASSIRSR